jgi:hypothetical protein
MKTAIQHAQSKTIVLPNGCWEWQGGKTFGYPTHNIDGKTRRIHREVYKGIYGQIIDDVHHLCENRACINPSHLSEVEHGKHSLLTFNSPATINRKKTHCKQGHPLVEGNIRVVKLRYGTYRKCLTCNRKWDIERKARRLGIEQKTA